MADFSIMGTFDYLKYFDDLTTLWKKLTVLQKAWCDSNDKIELEFRIFLFVTYKII